jgi:biotin carboxyl carrier protein
MIKKLRVTVDGKAYDVTVEMPDDPPAVPGSGSQPLGSVSPASVGPAPISTVKAAPKAAGPNEVPSPLAGRVTTVQVQLGQEVKEGDHLFTLEAMKMNTLIFAPRTGKVAEIQCTVGAAVEEGQCLARIE